MNKNSYYLYEAAHTFISPARAVADAMRLYYRNPINPFAHTTFGRNMVAGLEIFERSTRRYGKPAFDLAETVVGGRHVKVSERVVWERPFCKLINFDRALPRAQAAQPRLLIVAPLSGHYATLLRGTVEAFLPTHDVYITDWTDARMVPAATGRFDLDDYIDYVIAMFGMLGPEVNVLAVCQPAVPVIAAVARMEAMDNEKAKNEKASNGKSGSRTSPASMILMGGPIDTRKSPTDVNKLAEKRGIKWFQENCIQRVPFPYPGVMRGVYPGYMQLSGFMAMNIDKHMNAHWDMFKHLVRGDGEPAEKHREFYDEYLSVMDLTEEFYLQTVDTVFVRHALPKGEMLHRDQKVDLAAIRHTALMTVEGENDDISGVGQTKAAHDLCVNLPKEKQLYRMQLGVGHYGVFNGSRFRTEIAPAITAFIAAQAAGGAQAPAKATPAPALESRPAETKPAEAAPVAATAPLEKSRELAPEAPKVAVKETVAKNDMPAKAMVPAANASASVAAKPVAVKPVAVKPVAMKPLAAPAPAPAPVVKPAEITPAASSPVAMTPAPAAAAPIAPPQPTVTPPPVAAKPRQSENKPEKLGREAPKTVNKMKRSPN